MIALQFVAAVFLAVSSLASAAPTDIKGKVVDPNGEPVIGAAVLIKGTNTGTVTDLDGNFTLPCTEKCVLVLSSTGFITSEVSAVPGQTISAVLDLDVELLDEIIVVGYGTKIRKEVVGAVDIVNSEFVQDRGTGNVMQALQGAAPNLTIQTTSANPNNSSMNVNIRGISTLNNNTPLVIIDGVTTDLNALNKMNPDDIASVSVLKDAGSAAIYGSRSASGVILVTTKMGKKMQKPTVRLSANAGQTIPTFLFEPVKGYENAILRNQARVNVGSAPEFTPEQIRDIYEHTDQEYLLFQILQPAWRQSYNMSVSGGTANTTYNVSLGFQDMDSNFIGGKYDKKRYNFRTNVTTEYGRFKLISQIAFNRVDNHAPNATNAIQNATRWPVYYYNKMVDSQGRYVAGRTSQGILEAGGYRDTNENNVIGNVTGEFKIIEGLKAKLSFGADISNLHRFVREKEFFYYASDDAVDPSGSVNANRVTSDHNMNSMLITSQAIIDFDRTFAEKHHVSALIGASNESYTEDSNDVSTKFTDPELGTPASDGLTIYDPDNSYTTPIGLVKTGITSVFGRAGYSYDERYYCEFSFRYDGSSKFLKEKRWGFFPSASLGWRISQEKFMKTYLDKVGELKLRGSYGVLGNQNVGNYRYLTTYTVGENAYGFGGTAVSGTTFSFGNPDLQWEKTGSFNIGFDASFLKNKLNVTFDYFNQTTYDILMNPEVPGIYGGSVAVENTGKMRNQGWELTINYRFKTGDAHHTVNFNLADSKNKVIDFKETRVNDKQQMSTIIKEGLPLNSYYGWKVAGYFKDEDDILNSALPSGASVRPGDVKYVDYSGPDGKPDGVIDDYDRQVLGNAFPRYTYGLKYDFSFKGFDFSFFLQGVGKREMVLRGEMLIPFASDFTTTMFRHQVDTWTPENTDARWPRLAATGSASNLNNWWKTSDLFLLNAAYFRLKNLQIGYTLPKNVSQKIGMSKLRVFINAENLLTWSATEFWDPENTEFGNNMGGLSGASAANSGRSYPFLRYVGAGVNIEF